MAGAKGFDGGLAEGAGGGTSPAGGKAVSYLSSRDYCSVLIQARGEAGSAACICQSCCSSLLVDHLMMTPA